MRTWTLFIMAAATSAAIAADTKPIKDRSGTCTAQVPTTWVTDAVVPGSATSPDKAFTIIISSPKMIDTFAELTGMAPTLYPDNKVVKSTATEFEMEGKDQNGKPDIYRAVPAAGGKFCIGTINFPEGKAATARPVIETLK